MTTHQARHCSPSATATVVRTPIHEQAHAALHGPRFVCQRRCWQTFGLAAQQALKPDTRRNLSYRRYRGYPQWPMCPRRRQCHRAGANGLQAVRVKGLLRSARNIWQFKPMAVIRFRATTHCVRCVPRTTHKTPRTSYRARVMWSFATSLYPHTPRVAMSTPPPEATQRGLHYGLFCRQIDAGTILMRHRS